MIDSTANRKLSLMGCGSGLGCSFWDDFVLDSSKIEFATTYYRKRYDTDLPERLAREIRDRDTFCSRGEITSFLDGRPPTSRDTPAGEILEQEEEARQERQERLEEQGLSDLPPMDLPKSDGSENKLPAWRFRRWAVSSSWVLPQPC